MSSLLLPIMTGLFLVFAGILIGYFLWFRDRSDEDQQHSHLTCENDRLTHQLSEQRSIRSELEERISKLSGKIQVLQGLCDDLVTGRESTSQERMDLRADVLSLNRQLAEARDRLNEENARRTQLQDENHRLTQLQLDQQLQRLEQLQANAIETESLRNRCAALEQNIVGYDARIEATLQERDQAKQSESTALKTIGGLRTRTENQEITIRDLRTRLESFQHQVQEQEMKMAELSENLRISTEQYRQQFAARMALEETVRLSQNELQTQSTQFESATNRLLDERQELSNRLATADERNAEIILRLDQCTVELHQCEARIAEFNDQIPAMQSAVQLQTVRVAHLTQQRDNAMIKLHELEGRFRRLEAHTKANEETIRTLRRERGAVLIRSRQNQPGFPRIHSATMTDANSSLGDEYRGKIRFDEKRGWVFVEAPQLKDDLKKIAGIADVLETRLNELGVYTYRQIMEWDRKVIAEISKLFAFKDRIQRDGWQRQAGELYYQSRKHAA